MQKKTILILKGDEETITELVGLAAAFEVLDKVTTIGSDTSPFLPGTNLPRDEETPTELFPANGKKINRPRRREECDFRVGDIVEARHTNTEHKTTGGFGGRVIATRSSGHGYSVRVEWNADRVNPTWVPQTLIRLRPRPS